MHDFRRSTSHLRVVSLLGLLCLLASFLLFAQLVRPILSSLSPDSWRVLMIAINLLILSGTCFTVVPSYHAGSTQSNGGSVPFSSWRSQMRGIVLWTALPLCALALAFFIPPTADAFGLVFLVTMLAAVASVAARYVATESSESMRTPLAG